MNACCIGETTEKNGSVGRAMWSGTRPVGHSDPPHRHALPGANTTNNNLFIKISPLLYCQCLYSRKRTGFHATNIWRLLIYVKAGRRRSVALTLPKFRESTPPDRPCSTYRTRPRARHTRAPGSRTRERCRRRTAASQPRAVRKAEVLIPNGCPSIPFRTPGSCRVNFRNGGRLSAR
jgi:hypothetical protein